jgi:hypothetical protein
MVDKAHHMMDKWRYCSSYHWTTGKSRSVIRRFGPKELPTQIYDKLLGTILNINQEDKNNKIYGFPYLCAKMIATSCSSGEFNFNQLLTYINFISKGVSNL